jgi:hypothetical protein
VKLPRRAAASKALIAFSGGRFGRIIGVSFSDLGGQNNSFVIKPSSLPNGSFDQSVHPCWIADPMTTTALSTATGRADLLNHNRIRVL